MPRRLHFGGHQVDVLETLDQWYGPDYRYIKARVVGHAPACERTEGSRWPLNIYSKVTAKQLC